MHAHFFQSSEKKRQPLGKSTVERMLHPQSIDDWIWFWLRYYTKNDQKWNHPICLVILIVRLLRSSTQSKKNLDFIVVQSYFEPQKHALRFFESINKAKQNVRVPIPMTAKMTILFLTNRPQNCLWTSLTPKIWTAKGV